MMYFAPPRSAFDSPTTAMEKGGGGVKLPLTVDRQLSKSSRVRHSCASVDSGLPGPC